MAIEIVDFPIKNGGSFHCYVSSPEGRFDHSLSQSIHFLWGQWSFEQQLTDDNTRQRARDTQEIANGSWACFQVCFGRAKHGTVQTVRVDQGFVRWAHPFFLMLEPIIFWSAIWGDQSQTISFRQSQMRTPFFFGNFTPQSAWKLAASFRFFLGFLQWFGPQKIENPRCGYIPAERKVMQNMEASPS